MIKKDDIEKIFREQLGDFEKKPSDSVWHNIRKRMFLKRFLHYKPLSLNLWNILTVAVISTSLILLMTGNNEKPVTNISPAENNSLVIQQPRNNNIKAIVSDIKTYPEKENTEKSITNNSKNKKSENKNTKGLVEDDVNVAGIYPEKNNTISKLNNEEQLTVKLAEPHCVFSVNTEKACEPAVIKFINLSENCDSYFWDFGNGKISSEKNPTLVFDTAGKYKVTLTVTSGSFSDFETKIITVLPKPNAGFEIQGKSKKYFTGDEINFVNTSRNFTESIWNFGDDNTSSFTNPSHIFDNEGLYRVSLICINDDKCSDTAYINNLLIQDSRYKVVFPTAFSPDKSGQNNGYWKNNSYPNTVFYPIINESVSDYKLTIYNKYGAVVFESNDINIGWNGFYNNMPAPSDVYVWECSGKFEDGNMFKETGNVTLLYLRNQ